VSNLFGLRVRVVFHWGFWIRSPSTSRYQLSLPIPPPTTLIGALAHHIFRLGCVSLDGRRIEGEVSFINGRLTSSAALLEEVIPASTFYYETSDTKGFGYEDINRYVTLFFHQKHPREPGMRRYSAEYRMGAIKVGKVYFPSGRGVACYLIDEYRAERLLGSEWKVMVQTAAYNITRIGSKESIVSVYSVDEIEDVGEVKTPTKIKTRCYLPLRLLDQSSLEGERYYVERFWRGGWASGEEPSYEDFVVPGRRLPISSEPIEVLVREGRIYELGPEEVFCL
jgi:CRISPR-associated protein Cas5 subtype I-A